MLPENNLFTCYTINIRAWKSNISIIFIFPVLEEWWTAHESDKNISWLCLPFSMALHGSSPGGKFDSYILYFQNHVSYRLFNMLCCIIFLAIYRYLVPKSEKTFGNVFTSWFNTCHLASAVGSSFWVYKQPFDLLPWLSREMVSWWSWAATGLHLPFWLLCLSLCVWIGSETSLNFMNMN